MKSAKKVGRPYIRWENREFYRDLKALGWTTGTMSKTRVLYDRPLSDLARKILINTIVRTKKLKAKGASA